MLFFSFYNMAYVSYNLNLNLLNSIKVLFLY